MSTWICLGSSESAPDCLRVAQADYPDAKIVTTNSGIRLAVPDVYFLSDHVACETFAEIARESRRQHGTHLVTLWRRDERALQTRGVQDFDQFIRQQRPLQPQNYHKGQYTDNMFSGLYCAQYALIDGKATTLVVVGHEGYPLDEGEPVYWDNEPCMFRKRQMAKYTNQFIGPWWRQCVADNQEVTFHFYGRLRYEVNGPNVRHTESPIHPCAAACEHR